MIKDSLLAPFGLNRTIALRNSLCNENLFRFCCYWYLRTCTVSVSGTETSNVCRGNCIRVEETCDVKLKYSDGSNLNLL